MEARGPDILLELRKKIDQELRVVRGQVFLVDLEDTVVMDVSPLDSKLEGKYTYYAIPSMCELVAALNVNNNVVYYTSASKKIVTTSIKNALPDEIKSIPTIDGDDTDRIVSCITNPLNFSRKKTLDLVKSVYPGATPETVESGSGIISSFVKNNGVTRKNGIQFARKFKFPQIFVSPKSGFLIDNGFEVIERVVKNGWPVDRAIRYVDAQGGDPSFTSALNVSKRISESILKNL